MLMSVLMAFALWARSPVPPPNPHALVDGSIRALRHTASAAAKSVRLTGIEHTWILGNAERAEGPWRVTRAQFVELYDVAHARLRRTEHALSGSGTASTPRILIVTDSVEVSTVDGRYAGGSRGGYEDFIDRVDGSPVRVLELAAASGALGYAGQAERYGVAHDVVTFPWRNGRMRIEISRETHLPDATVIDRPYPDNFRWGPFGDVSMRTENVDWQITASGSYWPMQQKIFLNRQPLRDVTYTEAALDPAPAPLDSFFISDSARAQFAEASTLNFSSLRVGARGRPTELEPGILRIPDFWSETLVKQDDGIVIFEAHISAQYLHDLVEEAHRRWPGARIKALVVTSDPWAHLGGVREAMALRIPIYVNERSIPFLTHLAAAPHVISPDSLARTHAAPRLLGVSRRTLIGTGANRIELYPVGGPYAERMLMAYFPTHKLLYGADLVFPTNAASGSAPEFDETPATDLVDAVTRERLAVDTVFCVQNTAPVRWSDLLRAVLKRRTT
jgi:hypothetical protein